LLPLTKTRGQFLYSANYKELAARVFSTHGVLCVKPAKSYRSDQTAAIGPHLPEAGALTPADESMYNHTGDARSSAEP